MGVEGVSIKTKYFERKKLSLKAERWGVGWARKNKRHFIICNLASMQNIDAWSISNHNELFSHVYSCINLGSKYIK